MVVRTLISQLAARQNIYIYTREAQRMIKYILEIKNVPSSRDGRVKCNVLHLFVTSIHFSARHPVGWRICIWEAELPPEIFKQSSLGREREGRRARRSRVRNT